MSRLMHAKRPPTLNSPLHYCRRVSLLPSITVTMVHKQQLTSFVAAEQIAMDMPLRRRLHARAMGSTVGCTSGLGVGSGATHQAQALLKA